MRSTRVPTSPATRRAALRRRHGPLWLLVGLLTGGCGEDQPPARDRLPAVDVDWQGSLPDGLSTAPVHALYLVHSPDVDRTDPADPFAEIVFATTDTGYQMDTAALGPTGSDEGQWLRFGLVQDLAVVPLGARYLLDPGAVQRVRVHGELGGAWYAGESTELEVRADLLTGALDGRFQVTLESEDGPSITLSSQFAGQIERDCTLWVYTPGLDVHQTEPTGGPCGPVLEAIDGQPARDDGPQLPPGFSATSGSTP